MPPRSCHGSASCGCCGLSFLSIQAFDAAQDSTLILSVKCYIFFLLSLLVPLDSSIILTPIVVTNNIVPALGSEDSMKGGIVH